MPAPLSELFPSSPESDLQQLNASTSGHLDRRWGLGEQPAVLVVDMTRSFISDRASSAFVPTGEACAEAIARLLKHTRTRGFPTFFTRGSPFQHEAEAGAWLRGRGMEVLETVNSPEDHEIVETLSPGSADVVVVKAKPSGFFGTQLQAMLNYHRIDSLIITGVTTSGCVRATVNDAFNLNYRMIIPTECVADRAALSHEVELFDMAVKYADVMTTTDLLGLL